jgi:hypothetical protein
MTAARPVAAPRARQPAPRSRRAFPELHEDDGKENADGGCSIVGIGMISGARCMIAANDSGIKGGAAHPRGASFCLFGGGSLPGQPCRQLRRNIASLLL